jgi:hypothetical protein
MENETHHWVPIRQVLERVSGNALDDRVVHGANAEANVENRRESSEGIRLGPDRPRSLCLFSPVDTVSKSVCLTVCQPKTL